MSTPATRVKHFIKGRAAAFLSRYEVGRRLIATLGEERDARITALEAEVARLKDAREEVDRLTAAVGNSALVIADLEDRIAGLMAEKSGKPEELGR